ncbi:reverse transcriptase (RNA-dependent DNA polymerase) domain-containing protein [Phthorimaea operculella]|nr:reverse transcriptase (RNA-dependent DNA polymerase) domain-containing protein [Phthorimaea operculella]
MNNCISHCKVYQYADDTCLMSSDKDLNIALEKLQQDFDTVCKWSHDAGLVLNAGKTKFVHVHSTQCRTVTDISVTAHDHQCLHSTDYKNKCKCPKLQQVDQQRYLGLIIDSSFNWGPHIDSVCNRLRAIMAKFYIIKDRIPYSILLEMYKALVDSVVSYGLTSYGRTFKTYLAQIYRLQHSLIKHGLSFPEKHKTMSLSIATLFQ